MKKCLLWLIPIILVTFISPFISSWDIDIANYYFNSNTGQFHHDVWTEWFYSWGYRIPVTLSVLSFFIFIAARFFPRLKQLRAPCLLLTLTMALGSGLLAHLVFKDHWGRPRPKQVIEFGGTQAFRPYYSPNFSPPQTSKSFPSGHATTGFFFLAFLPLAHRHKSRFVLYFGICSSLFFGLGLSYCRIAMGGHFFSDTIFSAIFMWFTALALDWWIYDKMQIQNQGKEKAT